MPAMPCGSRVVTVRIAWLASGRSMSTLKDVKPAAWGFVDPAWKPGESACGLGEHPEPCGPEVMAKLEGAGTGGVPDHGVIDAPVRPAEQADDQASLTHDGQRQA